MNLFTYDSLESKFYILYPHLTVAVNVESGCDDKKYIVFDIEDDMHEFFQYLDDNGLDSSELDTYCFGNWDDTAIKLEDFVK
jgi:hypothetical protein